MAAVVAAAPALLCCGLPCLSCLASCGLSLLCRACCSIAGCFCPKSRAVGKLFYLLLFCAAAALGIALRYTGEAALASWATLLAHACDAVGTVSGASDAAGVSACFGLQAVYRVSAALCGFFAIMLAVVLVLPVAHHGAWLLKLVAFLVLLGCSLLISNTFFAGYAQVSRFGSVVFLVIQCIIVVDLAYALHEGLLARIEQRERALERAGIEPGCLSNGWKVLYLGASAVLAGGSVACLGAMYPAFGTPGCQLGQFFISETLVVGLLLLVASVADCGGKGGTAAGLLPPSVLWAYCTYLAYGALTNNPNTACNVVAANATAPTSVYVGLVFVILSVSWAAYSSAGGLVRAVTGVAAHDRAAAAAAAAPAEKRPVTGAARASSSPVVSAATGGAGAPKTTAADYADAEDAAAADGSTPQWGSGRSAKAAGAGADADEGDSADEPDRLAWVFHLVMAFAGLYLAMLCTNWGNVEAINSASGNPELSLASMWVRIASQWLIYALYGWSLIAPRVCPNRDFS